MVVTTLPSLVAGGGQADSTEFAESAENYNYLSSWIKHPKNYLSAYSDTLSRVLSVKNHPNFIFRRFRVFGDGSIYKNENTEFAESFRNSVYSAQFDHT